MQASSAITGANLNPSVTNPSAAAWPAIIAGSFVACATSIILLTLGAGIEFAAVSPGTHEGSQPSTFTVGTAIWLILTQWVSAFLGGYIAGRLRVRWIGTHIHEVFFRDTAHGLITWAVATVAVAGLLGNSVLGALHGGANLIASIPSARNGSSPTAVATIVTDSYGTDVLFRATDGESKSPVSADERLEAARILANALVTGGLPPIDRSYLAHRVAMSTGAPSVEAQSRVDEWFNRAQTEAANAKSAMEIARRAAAQGSLYISLSLLVGAFIAAVAGVLGGRLRDEHP